MGRVTLTSLAIFLAPWLVIAENDPKNELGVLLEPSFAAPKIFHPVEGAKSTVLVPARNGKYGVDTFTEAEWNAEKLGWPEVLPQALKLADKLAKSAEPTWVRDEREVILYGMIRSEHPFISSVIFSRAFHAKLKAMLGAEFLALVPERDTVFVFPKYGGQLDFYASGIAERHRKAPIKVSLEIFEVSADGCKVVGAIGE